MRILKNFPWPCTSEFPDSSLRERVVRGNRPTIHRAKLSLPFALALTFFFFSTPTHSQSFRSMGFGREDSRTTLVVKSDGSCLLTNETVEPRAMVEMQIKAMDRWQNSTDDSEDETQPVPSPNTPAANSTQKALTDQEL